MLELLLLLEQLLLLLLLLEQQFVRGREQDQVLGAMSLPRAGHTEDEAPHEEESCGNKGHVHSTPRLKLIALGHTGVQEVGDDLIGKPGSRHQTQKACSNKAATAGDRSMPLGAPSTSPTRAF